MPVSAPARERPDPRTSGVLGAAVASTLVFSAAAAVPFLGLLAAVAPFPIIALRVRSSLGAALLATMLAAAIIGTVLSPGLGVGFVAVLAAPGLLRIAVMVLVLVNPWAPQILGLIGLFDTWFDFRKWAQPPAARPS
jgi:hypothetical protein